MRMTDIWRGLVAQRCLWELGRGLVFHAAESEQQRNAHDLARDLELELPGLAYNERLARALEALPLAPGPGAVPDNLRACYRALVAAGALPEAELELVAAWIGDLAASLASPPSAC